MTKDIALSSGRIWDAIDGEKRRDRVIRRVSIAAWSVTFVLVAVFALFVGAQVSLSVRLVRVGAIRWVDVIGAALPLVIALALLSVLIATLATVGMFMRFRTASLSEIQLRLAALEDMLVSQAKG